MTAAAAVLRTVITLGTPQGRQAGASWTPPPTGIEPGEWYDPAFLQRLSPGALHVTIGEGENKVQDLKTGGG